MSDDQSTRDRIRALVRDVLDKIPAEEMSGNEASSTGSSVATRFVDTAPSTLITSKEFITRDESSKMVITEDDVRGLEAGAVLRIAERARLTPYLPKIRIIAGEELRRAA